LFLVAKSRETYSKKERESQRLKRIQDKKKKSEDRKANKGSGSLDEMMAYLDENGNLTSTPPDPGKRREFKLEDIQIGVPVGRGGPELPREGKISFFNTAKGFGFINDSTTGERLFFHVSDLASPVSESDFVTYDLGHGNRGPCAVNVKKKD
jgi:cold shock CspA family protein